MQKFTLCLFLNMIIRLQIEKEGVKRYFPIKYFGLLQHLQVDLLPCAVTKIIIFGSQNE